jgi:hypothetical protein
MLVPCSGIAVGDTYPFLYNSWPWWKLGVGKGSDAARHGSLSRPSFGVGWYRTLLSGGCKGKGFPRHSYVLCTSMMPDRKMQELRFSMACVYPSRTSPPGKKGIRNPANFLKVNVDSARYK